MFLFGQRKVAVPLYGEGGAEDAVELRVKALEYAFGRLHIAALSPFLTPEGAHLRYKTAPPSPTTAANAKLDVLYNIAGLEKLLVCDEHRVLVDYAKNKFRALCILSSEPGLPELPTLGTGKSHRFEFSVLLSTATDAEVVALLVASPIYIEHADLPKREEVARRVVAERVRDSSGPQKNEIPAMVHAYLTTLAMAVQIERIYNASVAQRHQSLSSSPHRTTPELSSWPLSPSRSRDAGLAASPSRSAHFLEPVSPLRSATHQTLHRPSNPTSPGRHAHSREECIRPASPTQELRRRPSTPVFLRPSSPTRSLREAESTPHHAPRDPASRMVTESRLEARDTPQLVPSLAKLSGLRKKPSMGILNADALYALSVKEESPVKRLGEVGEEEKARLMVQCTSAVKLRVKRERQLLAMEV